MYYFKANDKDETKYGPLDAEQIREWVREKRMDDHSLVRKSPYEEWRPLNLIEELSYICREAAESPVPSTPLTIPAVVPAAAVAPAGQPIKPGKLQAVAIMTLAGGIWAILTCFGIGLGTAGFWIPWIYSLVLGIMAIMKGSQMLGSNPAPAFASARTIAIMQIVNIINCDMVNLTLGIITLVFLSDPEVREHLRSQGVET
ncbi:MAG: hypothetical protein ACJAX6_000265 [Limisphaerales bacterium]|jgi:hypothetical protein